ncbi:ladderlectin-like [Halichoeres trimaculatus]|uniref:ladderlectin-like n=1 Tax=Halichoeres trimaculatus TaxID=147232 RepID=UPI003D9DDA65
MKILTSVLLVCAGVALANAGDGVLQININRFASCPAGWIGCSGRCFLYVDTPKSWADAEKHCLSQGGNLASVHSHVEHDIIQGMLLRATNSHPLAWLGGSDAAQEGTWLWSDGTPFDFEHWDVGQPDNKANAGCMLMNFGDDKKFDDQPCDYLKSFVCAKTL